MLAVTILQLEMNDMSQLCFFYLQSRLTTSKPYLGCQPGWPWAPAGSTSQLAGPGGPWAGPCVGHAPCLYLYYYIKKNLGNFKRWISFSARFEGCRPPRNANKGSMDRLFDVDGHGPKKSRILDQPDEKIQFEIFDKLSWPQLLTNFYEILTSCLPS